jgi:ORF6N domain-containing protein
MMSPRRTDAISDAAAEVLVLRGQRVMLDSTLANLYGVATRRLNEQVRRNRHRFPDDFLFELTRLEFENLKSQNATSSWGGRRKRPLAFTEHGAIMAATILNSRRAIDMSVYVVRVFVRLREHLASNRGLARKLAALERSLMALDLNTQRQFSEVYEAIRALMTSPTPKRRPIGFTAPLDVEPKPAKPR